MAKNTRVACGPRGVWDLSMPVGDRKEGKRKGQREGWSQDEGTCAAEDALKSGTGQDQKRIQHRVS